MTKLVTEGPVYRSLRVSDVVTTVWYSSEGESRYDLVLDGPFNVTRPIEAIDIARYAAHDFHTCHDGWEARWPREFTLYETEDGPPIETFEVEREAEPVFYAYRKKL
jgi:hypothetical protein